MPPIWDTGGGTHNNPSELFITTPSPIPVDVHIETADGITFVLDTTVVSGTPLQVELTPTLGQLDVANQVNITNSLIVNSSQAIQCVHKISGVHNQTLVTLKGRNGLGQDFWAGSQVRNMNANYDPDEYHFITVMATEDNTTIEIETPFAMYADGGGNLPNPMTITLDAKESYLIRGHNPIEHVCGSHITSDKDIVAISGSTHTRIAGGGAADGGTDQLVPIELMWKDFVVVKGDNDDPFDYATIVATEDNTNIYLDGNATAVATIDAGEYYDYTLTGNFGDPHYLRTDKRAYCYHMTGASQDDEVGMSAIPQMDCTGSRYIEFSLFDVNTVNQVMNLIVPPEAEGTLQVNGVDYQSVPGVTFNNVPGFTDWTSVSLPNSSLATNNIITSEGFFHAGFMTGNGGATGTYGFLSGFNDAYEFQDPVTGLPSTVYTVDTLCPGETIDHCLLVYSCADDHNIINVEGNDGNVVVTPPSEPFDTCFSYTAPFDYAGNDTITFTVENRFEFTGTIDIVFVVVNPDTPINAGDAQEVCSETTGTLSAVDPDPMVSGTWTVLQGGSTITDPNSPSTGVTDLQLGNNVFLWSQDYGCQVNQSLTQITVYDGNAPDADAGPDVELCSDENNYVMQANDPGVTATGTWEINQGTATIFNINSGNATVTNLGIGENIFQWNIDNGACPGEATVDDLSIFVFDANHPDADAGEDQEFCSGALNEATISANAPIFPATAEWALVSGVGTIVTPNETTTVVTNLGIGENVFQWSIDNGACGTYTDTVTITIYDSGVVSTDAGADTEYCTPTTSHDLDATEPSGPGTGTWTVISGSATFSDVNDANATASNLGVGENVLQWSIDNGPCASTGQFDQVTITIYDDSTPDADAGEDQELCIDVLGTVTLDAVGVNDPATGSWAVTAGGASVTDSSDPSSEVTGLTVGENTFEWTVDNGSCGAPTTDSVTIIVFDNSIAPAGAGEDVGFCTPISTYIMQATAVVGPANGVWTLESGTGTISDVNDPNADISGLGIGENIFRWTVENGPCVGPDNFDEMIIYIFDENQPAADAGDDQEFCSDNVLPTVTNLEANAAIFPGEGAWTLIQGSGNILDVNDPTTQVTALGIGENIFEWTLENGACDPSTSSDQVSIFIYDQNQAAADAGDDQDVCSDLPETSLDGNSVTFPAIGTWVLVSGEGDITDPNDPSTEVTGLGLGENVFEWSIANGPCTPALTTDQMTITVYEGALSPADAGDDQNICSSEPGVFLNGNTPISPATGEWTLVAGTGSILDATDPNSEVTGLSVGVNTFQWEVFNGACSGSTTDQVDIIVFDTDMPAAEAGDDQELCLPTTTTNMIATAPTFPATGTWELVSGSGSITDDSDPNTEITGLAVGENVFRWTVTNAPCSPATTIDLVSIFIYDNTQTVDAGADQEFCSPVSSTILDGNAPTFPATGTWTLVSGSGSIVNPSNPNSQVTGLGLGDNVFEWTIANGPCAGQPLSDQVTITIFDNMQADADAGEDQQICTPATSTTLESNDAVYPASGQWTVVSGTATITDPSDPTTTITDLIVGTVVLEWTINNGPCSPSSSSDQVTIEVLDSGAASADAGPDQELCLPIASATMAANSAVDPAIGTWTLVSGAGSIVDPNDPNTTINGLAVGNNVFEWSIDNGDCGGVSTDTVTITVFSNNSPDANAGQDQNLCTPETTTMLEGNSPIFPATGTWTLVSGTGNITDPADPGSEVTGLSIGENVFEWTILNGPCGNASTSDQVSIFVFDGGAPQANAGIDQELCTPNTATAMDADPAVDPGEGAWTLFSGTGSIDDVNDPETAITDLAVGENIFVWTLDYSTCGVQQDSITITVFDSTLPPANAGDDQELCTPTESTILDGNAVNAPAEGTWTLISGSGQIDDPNDPNTSVSNLTIGENIFVWSVYNGNCSPIEDRTDTVSVFVFDSTLLVANAGDDQELCTPNTSTTLEGSEIIFPAQGTWTLISGGGDIINANDPNTAVDNLPVGENIFEWTVDNGSCPDGITTDQVSIFVFDETQADADAGPDQSLCTPVPSINLDANAVVFPAEGTWTLVQGAGTIADINDPNTVVTDLAVGENIFSWEISNGPCAAPTIDYVSIFIFNQFNPDADAGEDQELCSPDFSTTLEGNSPQFPAGGTWTLFAGAGTIDSPNNPNTLVADLEIGENIFVWTVDNGPCANGITSDTVSVFVFDANAELADAGADQEELCTPGMTTNLDGNTSQFPGSGTWTLVSGSGTIVDPSDPSTEVQDLAVGENVFEWTIYNGPCAQSGSSDLVSIFVFDENQADAEAGPDQQLCTPQISTTMAANDVTFPAEGTWTLFQGSGTIVDENDPNTIITDLAPGTNIFVWTISNGPCANALTTDTVIISLFEFDAEDAVAGPDQEFCLPITSTTLDAQELLGAATGMWTVVQGNATFDDPTLYNTGVTDLGVGENILEWTVDNGPCGSTSDLVSIFIFDPEAEEANAGEDQFFCTPISTTTLEGNVPDAPGVGTWELVSGMGTIENPNDPNTALSGLTIGENIFSWTIYNGPCEDPTTDLVSIFIYDENMPEADAGDDIELCLPVSTTTLDAEAAIFPAFGTWELITGNGTIGDVNDPNTIVSGLELGINTFVWTINNLPCPGGISSDTVTVFVFEEGIEAAFAGDDQFYCSPTSTAVLQADELTEPNTGTWELITGDGVIGDPFSPTTPVSALTVGENIFAWTVYNGPCDLALSSDTVSIFIYDENQPPADAGEDQELCLPTNSTFLEANNPIFPATGFWNLVEGSANIVDPFDPETMVTDLGLGVNTFEWTIDNGPCEDAITVDSITILVFSEDAAVADAGDDIEICTPESQVTLGATEPEIPTTGSWEVIQGDGSVSDVNDPNAVYSGLTVGEHILQWTIYNGPCLNTNTFDFVTIHVYDATSPLAEAGDDQELCSPEETAPLDAAPPIFPAEGTWSVIQGAGSISDVNDPLATISGLEIGVTVLSWSVNNGPCGGESIDTVTITVFDPDSPDADAGPDQNFCTPFGGATLEGNFPAEPAFGTWTLISGEAEITNASLPSTTVFDLGLGENVFVWELYNGPCANGITTDTVSIFINDLSVAQADAGPDQSFCGLQDEIQMQGSETIGNTAAGEWAVIAGEGIFENETNEFSYVVNVPVGVNTYVWTVDNGECGTSSDTVNVIIYDPDIPSAFAGGDVEICEDDFIPFQLNASEAPFPAEGEWTILNGPIELDSNTDPIAGVLDLGTIDGPFEDVFSSILWTVDNGVCGTTSDTLNLTLIDCLTIEVPDAFSPNSDGINDFFEIPNLYKYPNNSIKIFNRWGALVYEASPYQNDWDGRSDHPATVGDELPVGTYYYILDLGVDHLEVVTGYIFLKR
ncbi:MAG: gliding motility-associated C-terminal domain-containing protein [Flavobacteriales bacterium]|nr:gliding motility-associated C-terminal domain-containing protein [Flavobacteriales bacterium]